MADALGRPVTACTEPEASARGAALWALEQLRLAPLDGWPASTGAVFEPRPEHAAAFAELEESRAALFGRLFGEPA
jgi:sugar (pentulose or hexulose) kinase